MASRQKIGLDQDVYFKTDLFFATADVQSKEHEIRWAVCVSLSRIRVSHWSQCSLLSVGCCFKEKLKHKANVTDFFCIIIIIISNNNNNFNNNNLVVIYTHSNHNLVQTD